MPMGQAENCRMAPTKKQAGTGCGARLRDELPALPRTCRLVVERAARRGPRSAPRAAWPPWPGWSAAPHQAAVWISHPLSYWPLFRVANVLACSSTVRTWPSAVRPRSPWCCTAESLGADAERQRCSSPSDPVIQVGVRGVERFRGRGHHADPVDLRITGVVADLVPAARVGGRQCSRRSSGTRRRDPQRRVTVQRAGLDVHPLLAGQREHVPASSRSPPARGSGPCPRCGGSCCTAW